MSEYIIFLSSSFNHNLCLFQIVKHFTIKYLVPKYSIERPVVSILSGTPGSMNRFLTPNFSSLCRATFAVILRPFSELRCSVDQFLETVHQGLRRHPQLWSFIWPSAPGLRGWSRSQWCTGDRGLGLEFVGFMGLAFGNAADMRFVKAIVFMFIRFVL